MRRIMRNYGLKITNCGNGVAIIEKNMIIINNFLRHIQVLPALNAIEIYAKKKAQEETLYFFHLSQLENSEFSCTFERIIIQ